MPKSFFDSVAVAFLMRSASYRALAGQIRIESRQQTLSTPPFQTPNEPHRTDEQQQTRDLFELQRALQTESVAVAA